MLRLNAPGSAEFGADLDLARAVRAPVVVLPKAESPAAVASLAAAAADWGGNVALIDALHVEVAHRILRRRA
jgi:citrate lyase beta subunit